MGGRQSEVCGQDLTCLWMSLNLSSSYIEGHFHEKEAH